MSDEVFSFRLLDLQESIGTVLKCMGVLDLVSFSLCSKKMATTVKSLNIPITQFKAEIHGTFSLNFKVQETDVDLWFRPEGRSQGFQVDGFTRVRHREEPTLQEWREPTSGNDWLRHLMTIFNQEKLKILVQSNRVEVEHIFNIVKDLMISSFLIVNVREREYTVELLKKLKTVENVRILKLPLKSSSGAAILLSNYQYLDLQGTNPKLDNILSINSVSSKSYINMTPKNFNRFLKLWQSGSNPRLKRYEGSVCFSVEVEIDRFDVTLLENAVMKGISYHRIPEETTRDFVINGVTETIRGGLDFMKKDGTKATVKIENEGDVFSIFQFFVWL